jgi:hypothetical protein
MKVKVNRQLSGGKYHVNFEVSDFTPEELGKMASFGVPMISLRWGAPPQLSAGSVAITQINKTQDATFSVQEEATKYEAAVLGSIESSMRRLRESKDEFSSSREVEL